MLTMNKYNRQERENIFAFKSLLDLAIPYDKTARKLLGPKQKAMELLHFRLASLPIRAWMPCVQEHTRDVEAYP